MMDENSLRESIWQGIHKEVHTDTIQFYLPFFFDSTDNESLCLIWDRSGILSDGGRTIAELKKRVGDIRPYLDTIHAVLSHCGDCSLVGGQTIVKTHFQTVIDGQEEYSAYLDGMNQLLKAMTLISILDKVTISEDGEVCL